MSTEIDQVLQELDPNVAQTDDVAHNAQQPDSRQHGQLINENAEMRRNLEAMRNEMEQMRAQMQQAQAQPPQNQSDQWDQWAGSVVKEVPSDRWLTDTQGAVQQVLAKGGRQLADFAEQRAERKANQVAAAFRADMEYTNFYPQDMSSEIGVEAVKRAVTELVGDQRWQDMLKIPTKRPQAWEAVHRLAQRKLGRENGDQDVLDGNFSQQRKAPFAEMGGGFRPMQHGAPSVKADGEEKAMGDMIDYVQARR